MKSLLLILISSLALYSISASAKVESVNDVSAVQTSQKTINTSRIDGCIYIVKDAQIYRKNVKTGRTSVLGFKMQPYSIADVRLSGNKRFLMIITETGAGGSAGVFDEMELHRYDLVSHRMSLLLKGLQVRKTAKGYFVKSATRILNPNAPSCDQVYGWRNYYTDNNGVLMGKSREYAE